MFSIKETTKRLIDGCIIQSYNGVNMYTPDGKANYAALWTRDFAYMVEYVGELMDNVDIKRAIEYLINGADENGWIPDRVEKSGIAKYTAGNGEFNALPNLDNGCFLVIAADVFLSRLSDKEAIELFSVWRDSLINGINCIPTDSDGFVVNESTPLHSPYGFTDTVAKSGRLSMETLLLWRAKKALVRWLDKIGEDTEKYKSSIKSIENKFSSTFISESGMLISATGQCRQIDIWASCYAVSIGFPLSEAEKGGIAKWLVENYKDITEAGQIRHLPKGEYWEKTFVPVSGGTYQNGAFWATPTGWFVDAIAGYNRDLALKTLYDVLRYFEEYGIYECVNGEYRNLDTYVVSATNVYDACKRYGVGV